MYLFSILFTVVISFLSESKGTSFTLSYSEKTFGLKSNSNPISTSAVSVGSPVNLLSAPTFVSLQSILVYTNFSNSLLFLSASSKETILLL